MKYLLVLAVVVVAFHVWRNNRRAERQEREAAAPPRPARATGQPIAMVACRACGTHLPQNEAVTGRQGSYCSAEHRQRIEGPPA
ncbi:MAG: hypothetical protein GXD23_04930 [Comamonadaceae bacterium]|jgi:uncharacterized protein|uniref:Deaminase n=1 Tax=Hydrogenophaga borbori TaxID=2294117 RepID=A0A372ELM5_9BURK|nr:MULTISPECIES: PP0621 family protein [Hydrogenophaga]NCT96692.1 hypothetical protein [Comamonadaceae bacterium]RFP80234.1 hypothetical protein DY262_07280 [Hydrogenophaga borbori]WQB84676.1 PP0621 family protein [Hydrogenophaga sp. SNF1]